MVMATISSRDFNWHPEVIESDDPENFDPTYIILPAPEAEVVFFRSQFADLPSAGIWEDLTESDDELLEELGSGWKGFAT